MHERLAPRRHRFDYELFLLALDLDELDQVGRACRLFSVNGANVFSFRERDYLPLDGPASAAGDFASGSARPAPPTTLKERVATLLARHGVVAEGIRVELVTLPRIAGYLFNPVSFYFCRDGEGRPIAALAEVTNTFREVKPYVLPAATWRDGAFRLRVPKHFYVSPFSDVDVHFDFVLRPPEDGLAIAIDDYVGDRRTLRTKLVGTARPLDDRSLAGCACRYPLLTVLVMVRIHWQALRLWLKRVPWFPKAARADAQRDLLRPHRSLRPAVRRG